MKTIDWVKQHISEWPDGCDYICVNDSGKIWLNEGDPNKCKFEEGCWCSSVHNWMSVFLGALDTLEDNDKVITKEDFEGCVTGESSPLSLDEFDEQLKNLLKRAAESGIVVEDVDTDYHETMGGDISVMNVRVSYHKK